MEGRVDVFEDVWYGFDVVCEYFGVGVEDLF